MDHQWREKGIQELSDAKENAQAALRRAIEAEGRERQLILEVDELKKERMESELKMKDFEGELASLRETVKTSEGKIGSLDADVSRLRGERDILKDEVASLKAELEKAAEDEANAMESGYLGCHDRLVKAGMDLTGHSLEDYCADLARALEKKDESNVVVT